MIDFNSYADRLLNRRILVINNYPHRIVEIEFYLTCTEHPDPFTHKDIEQAIPDKWYFHKKGGTFKAGTFKGLDITFRPNEVISNEKNIVYGGILIRSIVDMIDGTLIEGPCCVVDRILSLSACPKISEFVCRNHNKGLIVNNTDSQLYLKKYSHEHTLLSLYSSPRVGLTLKNNSNLELRQEYIMKNLRYTTRPKWLKKYRKLMTVRLFEFDDDVIAKDMKMTVKQVENIRNTYNEGKNTQFYNYINKKLNIDDLVKLMGLCNNKYSC